MSPWLIVTAHICLVPLAVAATRWAYRFENGLTPRNQRTWVPIINAQGALLAMYFAWGSGSLSRRTKLYLAGALLLIVSVVSAYTVLAISPRDWQTFFYPTFFYQMQFNSLWIVGPSWVSAAALLLSRPYLGGLGQKSDLQTARQLSMKDLFILTTFVAIGISWFTYVANFRLNVGTLRTLDVIPIRPLCISAVEFSLGGLAVACLVFPRRHLLLGGLAFIGWLSCAAYQWHSSLSPWQSHLFFKAYIWGVVVITSIAYRLAGYHWTTERRESCMHVV